MPTSMTGSRKGPLMEFAIILGVVAAGFLAVLLMTVRYFRTLEREIAAARDAFEQERARLESLSCGLGALGDEGVAQVYVQDGWGDALACRALAYNNLVTTYRNAARTFPATLVARQNDASHVPLDPTWLDRAIGRHGDAEDVSDAGRIMNPYMLWAAGMADVSVELPERAD